MTPHTGLEDQPEWVCLLDILQAVGEVVLIVLSHLFLFQMTLSAGSRLSSFENKGESLLCDHHNQILI